MKTMVRGSLAAAVFASAGCHAAPATLTFGDPSVSNLTPSLASDGNTVALSWTVADADGRADVFVAMSGDGGSTFAAPVRANDVRGDVKASEQQAPRLAVKSDMVAVLWTGRRDGHTDMRLAVSHDRGRSFQPAIALSPTDAPGTRGWGSVLIDDARQVQAVWLDTRLTATSMPAHEHKPGADHMSHGGATMASSRQDVHWVTVRDGVASDDRLVAAAVCFCCKTALAGTGTQVAAAWRDIYGDNQRDISFAQLGSSGEPRRVRVADDGWKLNGCPEDGPALAALPSGAMHIVWPTKVSDNPTTKGIFYASTTDGSSFSPRFRLDDGHGSASHPTIAASASGRVAAVWTAGDAEQHTIEFRQKASADWTAASTIANESAIASPVIAATADGFLLAWEHHTGAGAIILLKHIQ